MRWFKHYSDNYRGRSIETLYSELGHTGISLYFLLMEICTEKLEKKPSETLEHSEVLLSFSLGFVRRNLRISSAKLEKFLRISQGLGLFSFILSEKELQIHFPILLDLLDSDSKRSRSRRATDANRQRLDKEIDKEIEREEERDEERDSIAQNIFRPSPEPQKPKKKATASVDPKASALVAHYCEEFKFRYKINPSISRADSGILKKLFQDMGIERAKDLIKAYFEMPEPYIIKSKHPIKLLSYKINEVLVFAETGAFISNSQVRSAEKAQASSDLMRQIESGNI